MTAAKKKEIGLTAVAILITIAQFVVGKLALPSLLTDTSTGVWLLGLSVLWVIVMVLALALVRHPAALVVILFVPSVTTVVVGRGSSGAWIGAVVLGIALVNAWRVIVREASNRITYTTRDVFGRGIKLTTLGVLLALTGLATPLLSEAIRDQRLQLAPDQVSVVMRPLAPVLTGLQLGVNPDTTINDLINQRLTTELPPGTTLSGEQRNQLIGQLQQQFGIKLRGDDSMTDVVTAKVNGYLETFSSANTTVFAITVVAVLALSALTLIPFVAWIVVLVMIVVVWLGRVTHLFTIAQASVTAERLSWL